MSPAAIRRTKSAHVFFYSDEGEGKAKEPLHVHVELRGHGQVKFWIDRSTEELTVAFTSMKRQDMKKAAKIVTENLDAIIAKWDEYEQRKTESGNRQG